MTPRAPAAPTRRILVWDLPTRLFHWAIAVLVATLYVTWRVNWMGWHVLGGEILLAFLLFRIAWGFFGSNTARFSGFAASPLKALHHLGGFGRREPDTTIGHNPAGGWMVFLFLGLLIAEVLTGLYVNNDVANEGFFTGITPAPLANAITDAHAILWDAILAAVALHVAAIFGYAVLKGQNLVGPMITGRKRLPVAMPTPRLAPIILALVLFALAIALAVLLSYAI
ncbi:MAG: cytochrome b/b6 domain-containing protein [Acetobacteraceae bacterium]